MFKLVLILTTIYAGVERLTITSALSEEIPDQLSSTETNRRSDLNDLNNYLYEYDSSETRTQPDGSPNTVPNPQVNATNLTDKAFLWTKQTTTYLSAGKRLKRHMILTFQGKKLTGQCAIECLKHPRCLSFNFDRNASRCELNNASHVDYPQDMTDVKTAVYHTREAFSVDKVALGPCASDPCSGHGRCLETRSTTGDMAALCLCNKGWTGSSCSSKDGGPQWTPWMDWGGCSVTCHRGWRVRSRECIDSMQQQTLNPALCYGPAQEYGVCQLQSCPVWEPWGEWGECSTSTSCGQGIKVRIRSCSNSGTAGVDRYCLGLSNESTPCYSVACIGPLRLSGGTSAGEGRIELYDDVRDRWTLICANQMTDYVADLACRQAGWPGGHASIQDGRFGSGIGQFYISTINCGGTEPYLAVCPHNSWTAGAACTGGTSLSGGVQCNVNGVWSLWSGWSECSVTCENGTQTRTRTCDHPPRMHAGKQCPGEDIQHKSCMLPMCPVDGVWNNWSVWSHCSVSCAWGWQWRNRTCDGPYYSGAPCEGLDNVTQACNPRQCPVDGHWMDWGSWSGCSLTCGGGTQGRMRECYLGQFGGENCTGVSTESSSCNDQHCPVDGVWAPWSDWAVCSLTCGNGTQSRSRVCEGPFYGGVNCTGPKDDEQACNTQPCPVDGIFSHWASWGACSLTCGSGSQRRNRTCIGPFHGGRNCQGNLSETQRCNEQPCPIDGYYGNWMGWSVCTVTCGGGSQQRNRTCTPPLYGGQDCQGPNTMMQQCSTQHCPVDGVWLGWSAWSACNVTCGGGHKQRTRHCDEPQYGGRPCVGVSSEFLTCGEKSCEVPGEWFPWIPWTSCTVTCGGGTRQRQRKCDMNSYKELTAPCIGTNEEIVNCHTFACLPLAHTCTELGERGLIEDVTVEIDPDGPGLTTLEPVNVFCDMTSHNGVGVTVIGHNQEKRRQVQGYEGAMEYKVILLYNISFDHTLSIIDQSSYCEQYISWECFAALIHNLYDNQKITTGWQNRTRGIADYFGGATPGSQSCACGMNHSCAEATYLCNCDSNDEIWRKDDGLLTYKDDLPVYAFLAGDTGGLVEDGYRRIGPVRCHGK